MSWLRRFVSWFNTPPKAIEPIVITMRLEDSPTFGFSTIAKARTGDPDLALKKVVEKAIYGDLDPYKVVSLMSILVTYEDGTVQVLYREAGPLRAFVDRHSKENDSTDTITIYRADKQLSLVEETVDPATGD
jgi:hypothetical protein